MKSVLFRSLFFSVVFLAVLASVGANGDTLFNGKDPVRIGKGTEVGAKIKWADCDGGNVDSYKNPPYTLDKSDNCSVGPPTFGLECENNICKVVDAGKIQKYLPEAKEGDTVGLNIQEHSVVLKHPEKTVRLEK